jgi:hypothetical protein
MSASEVTSCASAPMLSASAIVLAVKGQEEDEDPLFSPIHYIIYSIVMPPANPI